MILYSEHREGSGSQLRFASVNQTLRSAQREMTSRLHLPDLGQALLKELPLVRVGDALAQDGFGALGGELPRVLRQFVTGMLEAVVDLLSGPGEDLLRFIPRGGGEPALLPLALLLGAGLDCLV